MSEKNLVSESRLMASFMLAATSMFSKLLQTLCQLFLGFCCLLNYTLGDSDVSSSYHICASCFPAMM